MFIVNNLTLKTRETLINNGNMTLDSGKIYGLTAPNGTGKTTLLRTLSGLTSSHSGEIYIKNESEKISLIQARKKIFFVETSAWLNRHLSGIDYLKFVNKTWSNSNNIDEVINFWGMKDFINIPVKKCSLGMKQKILLAMYAVSNTNYWILDEPTNGLDEKNVLLFKEFLIKAKKEKKTILFSSHQSDSIYSICDEIFLIKDKNIIMKKNLNLMEVQP